MAKPEWGTRYACTSCGCKFYDLNRPEPLCPRCGVDPRESTKEARTPRPSRVSRVSAEEVTEIVLTEEPIVVELDQAGILEEDEEEEEEEEKGILPSFA